MLPPDLRRPRPCRRRRAACAMIDCGLRRGKLLAQPRQVAAGDVAGLVGQHADHLVRRLGVHQRAGIDEDALGVDDEGVERAIVDDGDLDVLLGEAGGAQDRLRVVAQQLLDLGVANDRQPWRQALRVHRRRHDSGGRWAPRPTATAVNSATARAAGVVRRTLIGVPPSVMSVWDPRTQCSANLVAPPQRVNGTADHVSLHASLP